MTKEKRKATLFGGGFFLFLAVVTLIVGLLADSDWGAPLTPENTSEHTGTVELVTEGGILYRVQTEEGPVLLVTQTDMEFPGSIWELTLGTEIFYRFAWEDGADVTVYGDLVTVASLRTADTDFATLDRYNARIKREADDVRQRMVIIAVIFTIISAFFFFLVYLDKRSKQTKKESTA